MNWTRRPNRARREVLKLLGASLVGSASARAGLDPTMPHQLKPSSAILWAELCCNQAGASPVLLPRRGAVQWRTHVSSGLLPGLATDGEGRVLVTTLDGTLVELDRRGRRSWERRLSAVAASHPAVSASGTRVVLTRSSHFHRFDAGGTPWGASVLPTPLDRSTALVLPRVDGSFLVAAGAHLYWLEPDGDIRSRAQVPNPAWRLFPRRDGIVLLTRRGQVWTWDGISRPEQTSDISYTAASGASNQTYVAGTGSRIVRGAIGHISDLVLDVGAPTRILDVIALDAERVLARLSPDLLVVAKSHAEIARHVLTPGAERGEFGLVADRTGAAITVTAARRIVILSEGGRLHRVEHPAAAASAGLMPTRPGQVVAASAGGLVFGIGTTD